MKKLLIVEDDKTLLKLYNRILGKDFNIISGHSTSILKDIENYDVDLALLDLYVEGGSCIDYLKKLEELNIPMFLVSGFFSKDHINITNNIKDVPITLVDKPFNYKNLLTLMKTV